MKRGGGRFKSIIKATNNILREKGGVDGTNPSEVTNFSKAKLFYLDKYEISFFFFFFFIPSPCM